MRWSVRVLFAVLCALAPLSASASVSIRLSPGDTHQVLAADPSRASVQAVLGSGESAQCGSGQALSENIALSSTPTTLSDPTTPLWCRSIAGATITTTVGAPQTAVQTVDVTTYGAVGNDVSDDTAPLQRGLAQVCASGGVLQLKAGTYKVSTSGGLLLTSLNNCTLRGAGRELTTLDFTGIATGMQTSSSGLSSGLRIEDVTLKGATTNMVVLNGNYISNVTFKRAALDLSAGGQGIVVQGVQSLTVDDVDFYGDGDNRDAGITARAIILQRGTRLVTVQNSHFDYVYQGIIGDGGTEGESGGDTFRILNNTFDLGWFLQKSMLSGSTGTAYTATTLINTAVSSCTSITNNSTDVRVMATRQSGTVTAANLPGARIYDSAATFATNSVARGDIVRSGTKWAVVEKLYADSSFCTGSGAPENCCTGSTTGTCPETQLYVDGWRDSTTYRPTPGIANGAAYTVYALVLGRVTGCNAGTNTITVTRWYTFTGATPSTPASDTLFEILAPRPDYPINFERGMNKIVVVNNVLRRGWSDQISIFGDEAEITNNVIEDGQDVGITISTQGGSPGVSNRHIVIGNTIRHQGTLGIFSNSDDSRIVGNTIIDSGWDSTATNIAGIALRSADRNYVAGNYINRGVSNSVPYGIFIDNNTIGGTSDSNVIVNNTTLNSTTAGLRLQDTDAANTVIGKNNFDTAISDGGSVGTLYQDSSLVYAQASLPTPANTKNGSMVYCSNCNAASACTITGTGALAVLQNGAWKCF